MCKIKGISTVFTPYISMSSLGINTNLYSHWHTIVQMVNTILWYIILCLLLPLMQNSKSELTEHIRCYPIMSHTCSMGNRSLSSQAKKLFNNLQSILSTILPSCWTNGRKIDWSSECTWCCSKFPSEILKAKDSCNL